MLLGMLQVFEDFNSGARLVLASSLCATDTIAAMSFIPRKTFPAAHDIVLGEGITNDVVSVVIASSIGGIIMARGSESFVLLVASNALFESMTSSLCGCAFGGVT